MVLLFKIFEGNLRLSLSIVFSFMFLTSIGQVKTTPFKNGHATIVLKDDLKNSFFWWPQTLLNYNIQFDKNIEPSKFGLFEKGNNTQVPFQLSLAGLTKNGSVNYTLSVLTNLPSGGKKTFILKNTPASKSFSGPTEQVGKDFITIKTNRLTVKIPNSQRISGTVPGPINQMALAGQSAMGESFFETGKKVLDRIVTEKISVGSLFISYKINYFFKDKSSYSITVNAINDYDFLTLNEDIKGLKQEDGVSWNLSWKGFQPTHRQAPNHPYGPPGDKPGFERYQWETIDQKRLSYHHGIMPEEKETGKIPFEIGLYEPWPAERTLTSTVFWDERKKQSMGVFITDAALWNDKDYAIWHSAKILNIKFYYLNDILIWKYPVSEGTRATAISCYDHQKDIAYMNQLEENTKPVRDPLGFNMRVKMSQLSYNTFLQNRYGTISLDKVKDWDLTYPDSLPSAPVIFKNSEYTNATSLRNSFLGSGYNSELTISGPRQNSGYAPVPARKFTEGWLDSFNRFYPEQSKEDKAKLAAMYLLHAYVAADEEYMPMKHMLSGHPNFLADVKTIPALAGFQFPKHPESKNWADLFEKYLELNTRYHARPDVKQWNAQGGRWTENLGTYVWAFLRPTLRTGYVLQQSENGRNRVAGDGISAVGSWILNALSAPYEGESVEFYRDSNGKLAQHYWGIVNPTQGARRVHPPQGAHAARRKPARSLWLLGSMLQQYNPILAENLRYVSKPTDDDMETPADEKDPANIMYPITNYDKGTKPDFKSVKLTGYGTILRAAVNTPDELSVHLGQIDQGPNYRMGTAGQGGAGMIYFYAGGKSYSHNGREDVGDRKIQDTDLLTNFGVYKDGYFKSIGQNVLSRPLYDLGTGQFTEIVPSIKSGYAWPDYKSRSIMLVGSDYFITYDDVFNNNIGGRFSWFTHPKEEMPNIEVIKVGAARAGYQKTNVEGTESKGVWYDMLGDCMVFVSHKKGFTVKPMAYGAKISGPNQQTDHIFRNDIPLEVKETNINFKGTAGFIRVDQNKEQELVLFQGSQIGNADFIINSTDAEVGISAKIKKSGFISGKFFHTKTSTITFTWTEKLSTNTAFFIDGVKQHFEVKGNSMIVHFPAGSSQWQLSKGLPIPFRPIIAYSENGSEEVKLAFAPVVLKVKRNIERSDDGGESWTSIGETESNRFVIKGKKGSKAHVRVTAFNKEHQSEPSIIYPVYFTNEKPSYPDGLKLKIEGDRININWGQVLGVSGYKLYRRKVGDKTYQLAYSGPGRTYGDKLNKDVVYEYAVSAINANGASDLSNPVVADIKSWLQWNPQPNEKFRRSNSRSLADKTDMYYPE